MAEVSVSVIGKDLLSGSFSSMQNSVASMASAMQTMSQKAVTPLTIALGNMLDDVIRNGVDSLIHFKQTLESFSFIRLNMEMEMTKSSFTTLIGSAEGANQTLKVLREYANYTPFEFTQLTAATRKMLAFGFSVKEITEDYGGLGASLLDVIGNAASALGAGTEGIERITRALGQMRGLARVGAEDMNQLIDVGVQGYQILAEQLGMTVAEVRDAMRKGQIDAETGIKALLNGMRQQYGDGMRSFAQTAEGMSSTLNDYISDIKRTFGQLAYVEYKELLTAIGQLVSSPQFAKFAEILGVKFAGAIDKVNTKLVAFINRLTDTIKAVGSTDEEMTAWVETLLGRFTPFMDFFGALANVIKNTGAVVKQFVTSLRGLDDVVSAWTYVVDRFYYSIDDINAFSDTITTSAESMDAFAQRVVNAVKPAVMAFLEIPTVLKSAGRVIGTFVVEILGLDSTKGVISGLGNIYLNLAEYMRSFAGTLDNLAKNIPSYIDTITTVFKRAGTAIKPFVQFFKDVIRVLGLRLPTGDELVNLLTRILLALERMTIFVGNALPKFEALQAWFISAKESVNSFLSRFSPLNQVFRIIGEVARRAVVNLEPFARFFGDLVRAMLNGAGIGTAPGKVISSVALAVERLLQAVARALPRYETMLSFFSGLASILRNLGTLIAPVFGAFVEVVKSLGSAIMQVLPPALPVIKAVIEALKNGIVALLKSAPALNPLIQQVGGIITGVVNIFQQAMPSIGKVIQAIINVIQKAVETIRANMPQITPIIDGIVVLAEKAIIGLIELLPKLLPVIQRIVDIAGKLQTQLSGVGSTVMDAFVKVANVVLDLVESIVDNLPRIMPVLAEVARALGEVAMIVIKSFPSFMPLIRTAISVIRGLAQAVVNLLPAVIPLVQQLATAFLSFVNVIVKNSGVLVPIFSVIVGAVQKAINALDRVFAKLNPIVMRLLPTAEKALGLIITVIERVVVSLARAIDRLIPFADALIAPLDQLSRTFLRVFDGIVAVVAKAAGAIQPYLQGMAGAFDRFVTTATPLATALGNATVAFISFTAQFVSENAGAVLDVIGRIINGVVRLATAIQESFKTGDFTQVQQWFANFARAVVEALGAGLRSISSDSIFGRIRETLLSLLLSALAGVIQGLASKIPSLFETIGRAIQNLPNFLERLRLSADPVIRALEQVFWTTVREVEKRIPTILSVFEQLPELVSIAWKENAPKVAYGIAYLAQVAERKVRESWPAVTDALGRILTQFGDWLSNFVSSPAFSRGTQAIIQGMGATVRELSKQIINMAVVIINDYGPIVINTLVKWFVQAIVGADTIIKGAIQGIIEGLLNQLGPLGTRIADQLRKGYDQLVQDNEEFSASFAANMDARSQVWLTYRQELRKVGEDTQGVKMATDRYFTAIRAITQGTFDYSQVSKDAWTYDQATYSELANGINTVNTATKSLTITTREYGTNAQNNLGRTSTYINDVNRYTSSLSVNARNAFGTYAREANNAKGSAIEFNRHTGTMGTETSRALTAIGSAVTDVNYASTFAGLERTIGELGKDAAAAYIVGFANLFSYSGAGASQMAGAINVALGIVAKMFQPGGIYNSSVISSGYSIGVQVAKGIMTGINNNINNIADSIKDKLGLEAMGRNLSALGRAVNVINDDVKYLYNKLDYTMSYNPGRNPVIRSAALPSVTEKTVVMNVTVNQAGTATSLLDNLRYVQALVDSKIF